jgi:NADPH-dependent 2,4-dienoyl-CoA reductase/sulfur reductase-like enzyme
MREARTQVLVAGGGLGGVAAALAACARGVDVVLVEEHAWLGGQLTTQAVPPDEHPWIERFGCTARYRALREAIRAYTAATTRSRTRRGRGPRSTRGRASSARWRTSRASRSPRSRRCSRRTARPAD